MPYPLLIHSYIDFRLLNLAQSVIAILQNLKSRKVKLKWQLSKEKE